MPKVCVEAIVGPPGRAAKAAGYTFVKSHGKWVTWVEQGQVEAENQKQIFSVIQLPPEEAKEIIISLRKNQPKRES